MAGSRWEGQFIPAHAQSGCQAGSAPTMSGADLGSHPSGCHRCPLDSMQRKLTDAPRDAVHLCILLWTIVCWELSAVSGRLSLSWSKAEPSHKRQRPELRLEMRGGPCVFFQTPRNLRHQSWRAGRGDCDVCALGTARVAFAVRQDSWRPCGADPRPP